jgi:hypothetical protein
MKKNSARRSALISCFATAALLTVGTVSATMSLTGPATNWRIQTYGGGKVVLWYTGSSCGSGQLQLAASETLDAHKLLAAMILSSKATGDKMTVGYDIINGTCTISDIGVDGP